MFIWYMYAMCTMVLTVILVLIIKAELYQGNYICTHIVGGYILLFLSALSQNLCEQHYTTYGKPLRTFFGIIFFCTSYLAFSWIYLWFHEDFARGFLRSTKEFLLLVISFSLFLIVKKFHYLPLLLTYAILLGILTGLCNICILKKKIEIQQVIKNVVEHIRNHFRRRRRPRRVYVVFPVNPGIEELDIRLYGNNP